MNSLGNNTSNISGNNNSIKKHQHNTSLFRRLSERKVARDIEAAAAAGVSLTIPTTCVNTTNNNTNNTKTTTTTTTPTNTNILSSSLPLLSFNQLTLDPSEWPPLKSPTLPTSESDSPQPNLLPSIVKQKSQVSI
jgi:hypothetical protein